MEVATPQLVEHIKREARRRRNADKTGPTLSQHIEALAREKGYNNYFHLRTMAWVTPATSDTTIVARASNGTVVRVPKKG